MTRRTSSKLQRNANYQFVNPPNKHQITQSIEDIVIFQCFLRRLNLKRTTGRHRIQFVETWLKIVNFQCNDQKPNPDINYPRPSPPALETSTHSIKIKITFQKISINIKLPPLTITSNVAATISLIQGNPSQPKPLIPSRFDPINTNVSINITLIFPPILPYRA